MATSVTAEVDEKRGTLTIVLPIDLKNPSLSKTGNTLLLSSTRGAVETDVKCNGQNLRLNVNAYIYANPKKPREPKE